MDGSSQSAKVSELNKIRDGIAYALGEHEVPVARLMTDEFIVNNTDFDTWQAFLRAAGIKDEHHLETTFFNEFVKSHTRFADWETMLIQSSNRYVSEREEEEEEEDAEKSNLSDSRKYE